MYYILAIYFAILIVIGFSKGRSKTTESFLIADRDVGAKTLATSIIAGLFDGFILVSYTGFVYLYGWPAISLFLGIVIGFLLFYRFSERVYKEGRENSYYGMSDFFAHRYGDTSAKLVSFINIVFYLALLLIQFVFGSRVLQQISGLSYELCLVGMAIVLLIYLLAGGLKAVLVTDIFQWLLIILVVFLLLPQLISPAQTTLFTHSDFNAGAGDAIAFLLIGAMAIFSAPEIWQRCYAARDAKSVKQGLLMSSVMFPIIGILLALVGFGAFALFPDIKPDQALIKVFSEVFKGPVQSLGLVLLLSAIMSTADTNLFVIAPTITLNLLKIKEPGKLRKYTSYAIIGSIFIAGLLAFFLRDILSIALALASLSLGLFPVLIFALTKELSPRLVNVALSLGIFSVVAVLLMGQIDPTTSVISFPVVLITILIGLAWRKLKRRKEKANGLKEV